MPSVRPPAVAGLFYPADPEVLRTVCDEFLAAASTDPPAPEPVRAIMAPHAGYRYSGATAAHAYVQLDPTRIRRIILLGPTHRVGIRGIAFDGAEAFGTPLGEVPVDAELARVALAHPAVVTASAVHRDEHSLEVHLPFLQCRLDEFTVLPLAVGEVAPEVVADLLERLPLDDDTAILVSSDLSHYEPSRQAREHDARTLARILANEATLRPHDACGVRPLNGLLVHAATLGWTPELLDACNSGDLPDGDTRRVVGYASVAWSDLSDRMENR